LLGLFDSIYVLALTAWVGSILFFSFAVAPVIFTVLDSQNGAKFVRALFPRYYLWGAIAGAIALPAYVAGPLCFPEYRGTIVGIQALIILAGTLIMLYAGNSLTPAINAARDQGPEGHKRFEALHRRSVWLNGLVLLMGLGLLIAFVNRPAPKTTGLNELSPRERARLDAELNPLIERIEARYGFRPAPAGSPEEDPASHVDPETVREIETYYQQKRLREDTRRRGGAAGSAAQSGQRAGK
jgi:hypothetical protein